jgi:hypothetical protein
MKHTFLGFAFCIFVSTFIYSCSQKTAENQTNAAQLDSANKARIADSLAKTNSKTSTIDDPNQPSELAALMREMFTDTEAMKAAIQAGKIPADMREKFGKIYAAKPTDVEMKEGAYPAMAKIFLASMDNLYDDKEQIKDYNLMIGTCLACHQNQCPGPMVRIKKLLIN